MLHKRILSLVLGAILLTVVFVPIAAGQSTGVALTSESYEAAVGYDANNEETSYGLADAYDDTLQVTIEYHLVDQVVFQIHTPHDLTGDQFGDSLALAIDADADGLGDFQVIYDATGEDEWRYQEFFSSEEVPDDIQAERDGQDFTVAFPADRLGGITSEYRFVVFATDITDTPVDAPQVYMNVPADTTDPFDSDDEENAFQSSANYQDACVALCLPV